MNIKDKLPPILIGEDLIEKLHKRPLLLDKTRLTKAERLLHTQDIFEVFVPNNMTVEVYNTLYFLMVQSCKRKEENSPFHSINNETSLLCALAGMGKTETISRVNEVMFNGNYLQLEKPFLKVLPILIVQCSTISSFKGFCLSIISAVDARLNTTYGNTLNKNINTDAMLLDTAKVLSLHVLTLICEECNFLNESNKTISFANQIVGLSNLISTSILFVCTPRGLNFFKSSDYLARRSLNLVYKPEFNEEFESLVRELVKYNYTLKKAEIGPNTLKLIYDATNGIPALIKQILADCQVYAITSSYERIDATSIAVAIKRKLTIMEPFLEREKRPYNLRKTGSQISNISRVNGANEQYVKAIGNAARTSQKCARTMIRNIVSFGIAVEEI